MVLSVLSSLVCAGPGRGACGWVCVFVVVVLGCSLTAGWVVAGSAGRVFLDAMYV